MAQKPSISERNVTAIVALEHESRNARSGSERFSDNVAQQAGTIWFISAHAIWFAVWMILNAGLIPSIPIFDPFPYQFLTFVVSLEAIFLALFILMSQNRSNRQADARGHLDLQINLLAEQESTKMLQMLQSLCKYHGLSEARDPELEQLKQATKPEELLKELKESLPGEC